MTSFEILLSITLGGIWAWSIISAKLIQFIMKNNVSVLPLWVFEKKPYTTFSIINFILLLIQFGLPISLFFFFTISETLLILAVAFVCSFFLKFAIKIITRENVMLNYYLSAIFSVLLILITINNVS